jgi:hypothetical protein
VNKESKDKIKIVPVDNAGNCPVTTDAQVDSEIQKEHGDRIIEQPKHVN